MSVIGSTAENICSHCQSGLEVSAAISGVVAPGVLVGAEVRSVAVYRGLFLNREEGRGRPPGTPRHGRRPFPG